MNPAKLEPLDKLLYWINEREAIRLKREEGNPPPWTDDPILRKYRFCNVRRMDDRVSKWLMDTWYTPNLNHPGIILACALARFVNLPTSLQEVGFPHKWDADRVYGRLQFAKEYHGSCFNAAYIITGQKDTDKVWSVVYNYLNPLARNPPVLDTKSMEASHAILKRYLGFGSFMAGQVVADLRHAKEGTWQDKDTWAPIGPGSKRGMNIILGRRLIQPLTQREFTRELDILIATLKAKLPVTITRRLEAIDYQNCLCEYSKYCKALNGGRPKRNYP